MIETKRMWEGGPLRQIANTQVTSSFIPLGKLSGTPQFAGSYVCGRCTRPTVGVYMVPAAQEWICSECRESLRPKGEQPKGLRRKSDLTAVGAK
jgi:hypothetical protein